MPKKSLIFPGARIGNLTAIREVPDYRKGYQFWRFRCTCGNEKVMRVVGVKENFMKRGYNSCGCLRRKPKRHGHIMHNKQSPTYRVWGGMIQRCTNPSSFSWQWYGGREPPVEVCERWLSFNNFLADMGERPSTAHSLSRRNDLGNYEPGNCAWEIQIPCVQFKRRKKDESL